MRIGLVLAVLLPVGSAAAAAGRLENARGKVAAVDLSASTVTVSVSKPDGNGDTGKKMSFKVDEARKIIKNDSAIKLADLSRGDTVMVNYHLDAGTPVAISIGVDDRKTG